MLLQRRLSDLLQNCVEEINQAQNRKDQLAHGFKRGRSIITNATKHRKRRYVLNIDLQDFFGTINFGRVRGFFLKDRNFALHPDAATVLAQIACHQNSLPQGSPCSPVISNLIGHVLDIHLGKLAFHNGCTYSRYADDITFSTNKGPFPVVLWNHGSEPRPGWLPELGPTFTGRGYVLFIPHRDKFLAPVIVRPSFGGAPMCCLDFTSARPSMGLFTVAWPRPLA
jgi:RNA-directed DNA polymerase